MSVFETSWPFSNVDNFKICLGRFAIADLSLHTSGKVGLRWRTEKEVIAGKGQFSCASKRCDSMDNLHSYEVPFVYNEQGVAKNELVKVRVCINCARMLFYEKLKSMRKERRKRRKESRDLDLEDVKVDPNFNSHDEIVELLLKSSSSSECKSEPEQGEQKKSRRRGRSP